MTKIYIILKLKLTGISTTTYLLSFNCKKRSNKVNENTKTLKLLMLEKISNFNFFFFIKRKLI